MPKRPNDETSEILSQVLSDELDFEISLRARLAETIDSRITWALILQEDLDKRASATLQRENNQYKDASLDALNSIESSSRLIFPKNSDLYPLPASNVPTSQPSTHTGTRAYNNRDTSHARQGKKEKLLFIRNTTSSPGTVAKMACIDCSRSDFTNIQGLLNHCRLRHQRDFGTHDECMQKCAVIVPEEEQDWVIAHGTELGGVSLPSLKRLFEIAVGGGQQDKKNHSHVLLDSSPASPGTHLSRTLGHHKDTPALAPFLGKARKRRRITLYEEENVNIQGNETIAPVKPCWRMSYTHRNIARPALDVGIKRDPIAPSLRTSVLSSSDTSEGGTGTRFHIIARVRVADHSLWIPPACRSPPDESHTHHWMVVVDSPSYSLHITTFLKKMTVNCIENSSSTAQSPIIITKPPFVASSTTEKPFLARITLEWVGEHNPPMELEHWVELDQFKAANPVLGDEQVCDVELDRNTKLLPAFKHYLMEIRPWTNSQIPLVPHLQTPFPLQETIPSHDTPSSDHTSAKDHNVVLNNVLSSFFATLKESNHPPVLPHALISTPNEFSALIPGRRKAIEWGCARTLHIEYQSTTQGSELPVLSTADIFRWLESGGHFPRSQYAIGELVSLENKKSQELKPNDIGQSGAPPTDPATHNEQLMRVPFFDVNTMESGSSVPFSNAARDITTPPYHRILAAADPTFAVATCDLIAALKLPSFNLPAKGCLLPGLMGSIPISTMSVHGLLSLLTERFLRHIVRNGLVVAMSEGSTTNSKMESQVLTPSHILRGLFSGDAISSLALRCLVRPGIGIPLSDDANS